MVGITSTGDVAGRYGDGMRTHGFFRSSDGNMTPFDYPGALDTSPAAMTLDGTIVGTYGDELGTHGFVRDEQGGFISFDVPGSVWTFVSAVSKAGANVTHSNGGAITGWLIDSAGVYRGFLRPVWITQVSPGF